MGQNIAKLHSRAFARNENNLGGNDILCLVFIFSSTNSSSQIGHFQQPKNHCVLYLMPYHYAKLCTHAFARNENNLGKMTCCV